MAGDGTDFITDGGFAATTEGSEEITAQNDRDFSAGNIGNWLLEKDGAGTLTYDTTDIGGIDNKQGLLTSSGDSALRAYLNQDAWGITANTFYKMTARVYVPAGNTLKNIKIFVAGFDVNPASTYTLAGDTWTEITLYFYIGTDVVGVNLIAFDGNPVDGDLLYFDDISIVPVTFDNWTEGTGCFPYSSDNKTLDEKAYFLNPTGDLEQDISAENGKIYHLTYTLAGLTQDDLITDSDDRDFAGGDIGNWVVNTNGNGTVTYDAGPGAVKTGLITVGGTPGTFTYARLPSGEATTLIVGHVYRLQASIYIPSGNNNWTSCNITPSGISMSIISNVAANLATEDGWQTIYVTFIVTGADVTGFYQITCTSTTAGDLLYFDDVSIVAGIVPEIGGVKGDPQYANATVSGDILATGTGNLKFTGDASIECTIDDVSVFSEVNIHVDLDATGGADGSSKVDAYVAIQTGINDAAGGDTVAVYPGTYTGANNINLDYGSLPNDFTVISVDEDGNPKFGAVVDGEDADARGTYFHNSEGNGSIFNGFKIIRCLKGGSGGAFLIESCSPIIKNVWGDANSATGGSFGFISGAGANPIITMCLATNNASSGSHGLYLDAACAGGTFTNITLIGNTAVTNYAGMALHRSATVTNIISYGNTAGGANTDRLQGITPTYSLYPYATTLGDTPGAGCLDGGSVNPLFVDSATGDAHLLAGSPCIFAGTDLSLTSDLEGKTPANPPSMGAYEFAGHGSGGGMTLEGDMLIDL